MTTVTTTPSDRIVAYIRTYVPVLVGSGIAYLVGHFTPVAGYLATANKVLGTDVTGLIATGATALVIALYYYLIRQLAKVWPAAEKWFLGSSKVPTYVLPASAVTFQPAGSVTNTDGTPSTDLMPATDVPTGLPIADAIIGSVDAQTVTGDVIGATDSGSTTPGE